MRILLDENLPQQLRLHLPGHNVFTVGYMGWKGVVNGRLLDLAEQDFDVLVTLDRSLPFQQNLHARQISIILLVAPNNQLHTLVPIMPTVQTILEKIKPGQLIRVGYDRGSIGIIA